jgi:hypothetical protein
MVYIVTSANEPFAKYAKALVRSAHKHLNCKCFVYAVNWESPYFDGATFVTRNRNFTSAKKEAHYCAHIKGEALLLTMLSEEDADVVMWVDTDSLIRGPVDLKGADLMIKPKSPVMRTFASGVIWAKNNVKMRNFMREYANETKRCEKKARPWYADQKGLNATYAAYRKKIVFKPLPFSYCDTRLSKGGVIWTCKGSRQRASERFQKEMGKHL